MADARSRKTGEHSAQLAVVLADLVAMRAQIKALEERVVRLEAELAAAGTSRASKRPPAGPPPLPKGTPSTMPAMPKLPSIPVTTASSPASSRSHQERPGARKSVVDISEIAELVESIPPPVPRPRK